MITNRENFAKEIRGHDWYYAYSDDYRKYAKGRDSADRLRAKHTTLECPFDMVTLSKWAHNMVVEQFAEEEPGKWYRQPRKYKCVAPTTREALITQDEHDNISAWMESKND